MRMLNMCFQLNGSWDAGISDKLSRVHLVCIPAVIIEPLITPNMGQLPKSHSFSFETLPLSCAYIYNGRAISVGSKCCLISFEFWVLYPALLSWHFVRQLYKLFFLLLISCKWVILFLERSGWNVLTGSGAVCAIFNHCTAAPNCIVEGIYKISSGH